MSSQYERLRKSLLELMTLLEQIQNEAVDGTSDLATVLPKCRVLSAKLKNAEFTDWVIHELDGYYDVPSVPAYRVLHGQCIGDFVGPFGSSLRNVQLGESEILPNFRKPFFVREFREGVEGIKEILNSGRGSKLGIRLGWPTDVLGAYQTKRIAEHLVLAHAWTMLSENQIAGILSTIRNRILNFALEIMEENPKAGEAPIGTPPIAPERTDQIFHNTIIVHGNVGSLAGGNVGNQISIEMVRPGDLESLKEFLKMAGLPTTDISELESAINREPGARSIESGPISSWWTRIKNKIATGAIRLATTLGTVGAEELLKQGIDTFFQN